MNFEEFKQIYHIKLNRQQEEAVQSVDHPTLLLAVPGSGKTTVLVTRLGYMIHCCQIPPEKILTVTYTVSATQDMKCRFAQMFGEELANRLEFRTINGICAKIIHYYGSAIGRQAFTLVTEDGYRNRLLAAIYQETVREYPTESDLQNLSAKITFIKNSLLSDAEIVALGEAEDLPLLKIYKSYCSVMRSQNQMDYDDQMIYARTMLRKVQEVRQHFQQMYPYISVDEAQDTSKIQHEIIRLLSGEEDHLFMVGDEDQSIYGFRAAYPEALLHFEKEHKGAKVLLMEENFRSNACIVEAANHFIQRNQLRHKKSMFPARPAGAQIQKIDPRGRRGQYTYLLKMARECKEETAILYRDNESILPVIDQLERGGISYRIRNADLTFFSHRIVMDIENIIRFAMDPKDTELFLQIYYKMGMYMSKLTAQEACRISVEKGLPILDGALRYCKMAPGTQKNVKVMQTHLQNLLHEPGDRAVYRIVHFMGYGEYMEKMHMKPNKAHILESIAKNEPNPVGLLKRMEELADIIRYKTYDADCPLVLSTIHSSKGLEFDRVFLLDVKDGIFPEEVIRDRKRATSEDIKAYEEERRLFYVGATRAKNTLCIFDFKSNATFTTELR